VSGVSTVNDVTPSAVSLTDRGPQLSRLRRSPPKELYTCSFAEQSSCLRLLRHRILQRVVVLTVVL